MHRNFRAANFLIRQNYRTAKLQHGEISLRPNFLTTKIHTEKFPYGENPYGEISLQRNFVRRNFRSRELKLMLIINGDHPSRCFVEAYSKDLIRGVQKSFFQERVPRSSVLNKKSVFLTPVLSFEKNEFLVPGPRCQTFSKCIILRSQLASIEL